ncbi:23S rRNA (guanosine2251-2'-O)-methyltransferase [Desulfonispora thiosulfatigenes DSM 11270]|uniref:23S rRNA (Guanosine2251-2'-O)-methyltransferase n=1 Tax=Desulfonispora thiosulfatigenes DSM 11270 TaxID=656914 RepID=A0A1W1UTG6_DESTI|nr:23S rRNA (guanosine(2251)-2'-O)-methyltransferase RlmB [Desulfonispora thiosulfatigenes]SMB84402.1 23S rRNA (guanosine2251-2'-O)-methyltransferase [Desulfonispora thiosulfatigenes DSM 11270]
MYIFGRNPVIELLKTDKSVNKVCIAKGIKKGPLQEIIALTKEKRIPLQEVEKSYFDKVIPDENHQGVLASVASAEYVEWEELLTIAKEKEQDPLIVILDGLEDPHNLGAILRTCDAVGVHGVIIPKRRTVSLTEGVAKSAAGAVEYVPVARVSNITQTIEKLKQKGVWILGAEMGGTSLYEQDLKMPLAIVIGSEGKGISRLVKEHCDFLVSLPMLGSLNSLNASVAAGVIMYEALRQRTQV